MKLAGRGEPGCGGVNRVTVAQIIVVLEICRF
jgi:hypothetical protein